MQPVAHCVTGSYRLTSPRVSSGHLRADGTSFTTQRALREVSRSGFTNSVHVYIYICIFLTRGRAGRNTCLGKARNNMLRPNSESNGGHNQIIHDRGRPEHLLGPSPYINVYIHIHIYRHIYTCMHR